MGKMSGKKTNIKIKHHNYNLYSKKKSRGKQTLAVILTVAAAAVLCVVGYGAGKPIMEYFGNREQYTSESGSVWTPPTTEDTSHAETVPPAAESVESAEPPAEEYSLENTFILPEGAALNSGSLNSAIAAAKNGGYTGVAVTLKDADGYFLYKSGIEGIKDGEGIKGALTAEQICDIVTKAGLDPVARINTLMDHVSPSGVEGIKFVSVEGWTWLDNYAENGGKTWLTPFNKETADFIGEITEELSAAGFKTIVLTNTKFPNFNSVDYSLLADIGDSSKRLTALWRVTESARRGAEKNGAEILVEMGAGLFEAEKLSTDAELAGDKEKLKNLTLLIGYSAESNANVYVEAKTFISKMNALYPGQEYAVLIKGSGFSGNTLAEVKRAFEESEIVVFSE